MSTVCTSRSTSLPSVCSMGACSLMCKNNFTYCVLSRIAYSTKHSFSSVMRPLKMLKAPETL